jgi:hypothetical protein
MEERGGDLLDEVRSGTAKDQGINGRQAAGATAAERSMNAPS